MSEAPITDINDPRIKSGSFKFDPSENGLPDLTPTLSAAMELPEVRALVELTTHLLEGCDRLDVKGGNIEATRAALAPFTEAKP